MRRRRILLNALNSKTGGGKSILTNYLTLLSEDSPEFDYLILTPDASQYIKYENKYVSIIDIHPLFKLNVATPFLYLFVYPRLIKRLKIDTILNLGDIVIPTVVPQLYLFDWPYAVYPESVVWQRMDRKSLLTRRIKLVLFRRYLKYATIIAAQTGTMKQKLHDIYKAKNVVIVPNAVSLDHFKENKTHNWNLDKNKFKFLYLTHYYPHKNIEILIDVAREIKSLKLPYQIILTIEQEQHKNCNSILKTIENEDLHPALLNLGSISMKLVPTLYEQVNALLMPTLLESFSGTYVEAMYHEKPILTSNLDFAIDVCGEAAYYFDPFSTKSILKMMDLAVSDHQLLRNKIDIGKERLNSFIGWKDAYKQVNQLLDNLLNK